MKLSILITAAIFFAAGCGSPGENVASYGVEQTTCGGGDAASDATVDAAPDATADVVVDAVQDAVADATADASDSSADSGDAGADAGHDAGSCSLMVVGAALAWDQAGQGAISPMSTGNPDAGSGFASGPITTQNGDSYIVFLSEAFTSECNGAGTCVVNDNKGNAYTRLAQLDTSPNCSEQWGGWYGAEAFACINCDGGAGHVWNFPKPNDPTNESTMFVEVIGPGATRVDAVAASCVTTTDAGGGGSYITSEPLTTTAAGDVLTYAGWGSSYGWDYYTAIGAGWMLSDEDTNAWNSMAGGAEWRAPVPVGTYTGTVMSTQTAPGSVTSAILVAVSCK